MIWLLTATKKWCSHLVKAPHPTSQTIEPHEPLPCVLHGDKLMVVLVIFAAIGVRFLAEKSKRPSPCQMFWIPVLESYSKNSPRRASKTNQRHAIVQAFKVWVMASIT
ncbi:MAG: hypothetical protein CM15mP83_7300 [Flavobacteriaceae bacterium]|nr:MAG: hypothetical protein CM15mP83_7300 [Flavobacteriaceae bacterium]